jgi:glutathione peroxidase
LKGRHSLIVNIANEEGYLQDLRKVTDLGVPLLLFPSNSFKNEPHGYKEIKSRCQAVLGGAATIFQKVEVNGPYLHPVYRFLKRNTSQLYDA